MTTRFEDLLPALERLSRQAEPLGLVEVGSEVCLSPGRTQRVFRRIVGESPKQYQLRVRLQRAAALLLGTNARIVDIAMASGFESHEVFSRAFARQFETTPSVYRKISQQWNRPEPMAIAASTAPCIGLYRKPLNITSQETSTMTTDHQIERRTVEAQPFLFGTRRLEKDKMAEGLAEVLPAAFGYAMSEGLEMSGPPLVRYIGMSAAFITIEAGVPLAADAPSPPADSGLSVGSLPAGEVAFTVHRGPYETLGDAHVALDLWMNENDVSAANPPWEIYITDPAEVPDPNDWLTHVYQPIG